MKKFNELDSNGKIKRLRGQYFALLTGKWASVISPFVAIGIANFDTYFTEVNGVKMSIGCILAMFVGGIAIFNEVKKNDESKKISGVVGWGVALALVYLLNAILQDLLLIVFGGFLGQVVASGFSVGAEYKHTLYRKYSDANINASAFIQPTNYNKNTNDQKINVGSILG